MDGKDLKSCSEMGLLPLALHFVLLCFTELYSNIHMLNRGISNGIIGDMAGPISANIYKILELEGQNLDKTLVGSLRNSTDVENYSDTVRLCMNALIYELRRGLRVNIYPRLILKYIVFVKWL